MLANDKEKNTLEERIDLKMRKISTFPHVFFPSAALAQLHQYNVDYSDHYYNSHNSRTIPGRGAYYCEGTAMKKENGKSFCVMGPNIIKCFLHFSAPFFIQRRIEERRENDIYTVADYIIPKYSNFTINSAAFYATIFVLKRQLAK